MTTTSAIIVDAYRESNLIAAGATPSPAQQTEALARLTSLIAGVYGYDVGENLRDWMVGYVNQQNPDCGWQSTDWSYPISNSRLLLNHNTVQTIYLPENPENGARIQIIDVNGALATHAVSLIGNGRLIDGQPTALLNTNALNKTWMYDDSTAQWKAISDLTLESDMPFPLEFDDLFIIRLAARLNPRYGRSLSDLSIARLNDMQTQIETRYRQHFTPPVGPATRNLSGPSSRGVSGIGRSGRFGWM